MHERQNEAPSNIVGFNRYVNDSSDRVSSGLVREDWYVARLINPSAEHLEKFAADILMRVVRVASLKSGAIRVYAVRASHDGSEEITESDAVSMGQDGYFVESGEERGYLLDAFGRKAAGRDLLAAEAPIEV
jgi:hypothetical protein